MWQGLPQTRARLQKLPVVEKPGKGEEELLQRFSRSWLALDETLLTVALVLRLWDAARFPPVQGKWILAAAAHVSGGSPASNESWRRPLQAFHSEPSSPRP